MLNKHLLNQTGLSELERVAVSDLSSYLVLPPNYCLTRGHVFWNPSFHICTMKGFGSISKGIFSSNLVAFQDGFGSAEEGSIKEMNRPGWEFCSDTS